jgi:hypothetical protein
LTVHERTIAAIAACAVRFADLRTGAPDPQAGLALASIAAGNTAGRLWRAGESWLLWDKGNNVLYLAGDPPLGDVARPLAALIEGEIRAQAVAEGRAYFRVRDLTGAAPTTALFVGIELHPTRKLFYRFGRGAPPSAPLPDGVRLMPIDAAFLARDDLAYIEHVRAEVAWMWPSLQRFIDHGFGVAALAGNKVVCWCTAEYVSPAACGIGTETLRAYRGRGIATAAAVAFVAEALARGVQPHWEADFQNVASIRVAEKVGFDRILEAPFWSGSFDAPPST